MIIKIDSREQMPIEFVAGKTISKVVTDGLPFGDYFAEWEPGSGVAGYSLEMPVAFERKSLPDLFGTLSSKENYERFKREMQRAKENGFQLYLIVEGTMSEVYAGTKYSDRKGDELMKQLFTLHVKYGIIPVFCNNRNEVRAFMRELFEAVGRNFKKPEKPEILR